MTRITIDAAAPAPGVPLPKTGVRVAKYDPARMDTHPLIRFQPTHTATVAKSSYDEADLRRLTEWWAELTAGIGKSPWIMRDGPWHETSQGTVIIWTFSEDLDQQDPSIPQYGDDCE